ncbi:Band 7 domain-containing protein [Tumidithrix helvetica PCC 7403]|uniref:prohibitin family protein n=1 Tax=Tumidithrix helvetica TaxID=3457545 RepID=UPI003CA9E7AB
MLTEEPPSQINATPLNGEIAELSIKSDSSPSATSNGTSVLAANFKTPIAKPIRKTADIEIARRIAIFFCLIAIVVNFFAIVGAGERGVLMQFGRVQQEILDEGIHFVVPLIHSVQKLSVRVQKQQIIAEASSKDLQDVFADIALNWHIIPEKANVIFQQIGNEQAIVERIIQPAVEEVLKAIIAKYTAEEIITTREEVKAGVDRALSDRLSAYHIAVDDISLIHVHFSQQFSDAVETKQIAEQEAKRARFIALKAQREAEAKVNLAKGEAEAQRIIQQTLTPDLIQKQIVDKWNGNLPLVMGDKSTSLLDLSKFLPNNPANSILPSLSQPNGRHPMAIGK